MVRCSACTAESPVGSRFCEDCGAPLSLACPVCGAAVTAGKPFCRECGAALTATAPATATAGVASPAVTPVVERRVVSVLFADLVGFTPLSESRDAEQVRELLSGYFDTARSVIARYGGVVEKFIGDAVMAVWGVPAAHGDDAERAVRAALELIDAVAGLGAEVGAAGLAARAGVVTGEVAVTVGAVGEGMVAGDSVNTAARVQSEAEPGTVLVDDVTRQATAAAVGYADTGEHPLKGKAEPMRLWRATRVVAGAGGAERVDGLEAGFLGREREFRTVKDALNACVDDGRARLVSVVGAAGVGKSRLRWELFKYVDGLVDLLLWHTGRCLPYGDGVAYWALAEIVRARLDIAEEETTEQVAAKLDVGLGRWVTADVDREFLRPRLGALLGVTESPLSREDLFAGWRLWLERLTEHNPVVIVIEDLQWADAGLLDFIEHLLDWSADRPIFVLTLSRPELLDHRPTWGSGRRNSTALSLEPLPGTVITELLGELVPGLPRQVSERIVSRADGVPLYAVELVRSLVDRDLVQPIDGVYRLVGEVENLEVPASLSSLVAARIDALPPEERTLVQALAVLGSTFPRSAVSAVSDRPADQIDEMLDDLIRKEILRVRTDRLSPDRGQYAFTQSLLRSVAHDTLARRERRAMHLAVAAHLRATFADDGAEVAEVVAQHYRDAYEAVPDAEDAAEVRQQARQAFVRAGRRALSLGGTEPAQRAFTVAVELTDDEEERAGLLTDAGEAALQGARPEQAQALFESALAAHRAAGRERAAMLVTERLAGSIAHQGRPEQAIALLEPILAEVSTGEPDELMANLHHRLAQQLYFTGRPDEAAVHIEAALELAQALELPAVLAGAGNVKGLYLTARQRHEEAFATLEWSAAVADRHGLTREAMSAHGNAADHAINVDNVPGAIAHLDAQLEAGRRRGSPSGEGNSVYNRAVVDLHLGNWSAVEESATAYAERFGQHPGNRFFASGALAQLHARRGQTGPAHVHLDAIAHLETSEDVQDQAMYAAIAAVVAAAEDDLVKALRLASKALQLAVPGFGVLHECVRTAWPEAMDAALRLADLAAAEELMAIIAGRPVGHVPPYLRAELARFRARLAAPHGAQDAVEEDFRLAERMLTELGYPFDLANVQHDHAAWLVDRDRASEALPLLRAAETSLDRLGAEPALARTRELLAALPAVATV